MSDVSSRLRSLRDLGGNHPELRKALLYASSFPCQKLPLDSVSGSYGVSHLYFNLWELGVLSVFWGLCF